jgi:osmotically-inducible protein OsmY
MKKSNTLLLLLALAAVPGAMRADPDTDRKIEAAARSSYNYHTVLQDRVKVSVRNGAVTLTGSVADTGQRSLAADTAANLPGVTSVDNQLAIEPKVPEHSDEWIAFKIRARLLAKANVSATDTDVEVKDGAVTLTGSAQNRAQKDLTELYAKDIDGVKSVNNQLVVNEPTGRQKIGEAIDDASVTAQVKYELLAHRSTSALKTKVETHDGLVVIRGEADSAAEKDLVSKLASSVRGVKSVSNEMTIPDGR